MTTLDIPELGAEGRRCVAVRVARLTLFGLYFAVMEAKRLLFQFLQRLPKTLLKADALLTARHDAPGKDRPLEQLSPKNRQPKNSYGAEALKHTTSVSIGWLAQRLENGAPDSEIRNAVAQISETLLAISPSALLFRLSSGAEEHDRVRGRTSVFGRVDWRSVRKKQMPAAVATESLQAQQRFIASLRPELAGAFEATLILAAG